MLEWACGDLALSQEDMPSSNQVKDFKIERLNKSGVGQNREVRAYNSNANPLVCSCIRRVQ